MCLDYARRMRNCEEKVCSRHVANCIDYIRPSSYAHYSCVPLQNSGLEPVVSPGCSKMKPVTISEYIRQEKLTAKTCSLTPTTVRHRSPQFCPSPARAISPSAGQCTAAPLRYGCSIFENWIGQNIAPSSSSYAFYGFSVGSHYWLKTANLYD